MQLAGDVRRGAAELGLPEARERFAIAPFNQRDDALSIRMP